LTFAFLFQVQVQARNQLGTAGVAKSFLRGVQILHR